MTAYEGVIHGLGEAAYHSAAGLSSTIAKKILRSPAHANHYLTHQQEPKAEFDMGTLMHSKVLGVGAQPAVYPDEVLAKNGSTNTNAAREFEEEARANGQVPVKRVVANVVNLMAESVLQHPVARALLEQEGGHPEVSVFAHDPEFDIDLRCRFDFLGGIAVDLKKTGTEGNADGFARSVAAYGHDVQQAHYLHTYELATGEKPRFLFVVVEDSAPYLTSVHRLDGDFEQIGAAKARRARELYARARQTGIWPGYPNDINLIRPPMFEVYRYQDQYEGKTA